MFGTTDVPEIDIGAEIARVQSELILFRDKLVPAILRTPFDPLVNEDEQYVEIMQARIAQLRRPISDWQRAACRLAELLPLGPLPANSSKISRRSLRDFLSEKASPDFRIQGGRIIWEIELTAHKDSVQAFGYGFPDLAAAMENLPARLPEVRRWLMGLPVNWNVINVLCNVLPFIADVDPAFARLALEPETWRNIVLANRAITEEQRREQLEEIDGPSFAGGFNGALRNVLAALANNHFTAIEDFLDHPFLVGDDTDLMPHFIFAVLFQKVAILRQLAQGVTPTQLRARLQLAPSDRPGIREAVDAIIESISRQPAAEEDSGMSEIDIRAEVSKVENELKLFREKFVPAFLGTPINSRFPESYVEMVHDRMAKRAGFASNWQKAACRLAKLLPVGPLPANSRRISREDFLDFLFQAPTPAFRIGGGRIIWEIGLFMGRQLVQELLQKRNLPVPIENLPTGLAELGRWLLRQLIDYKLTDDLCSLLPFLADADPAFAKLILDPETWRKIALAEHDEDERTDWLEYVEGLWFAHCLNNALLHVLGALANNHFEKIEAFLGHPFLVGRYTHLMPHYVFAVLVEKVTILRQFSEERPELW